MPKNQTLLVEIGWQIWRKILTFLVTEEVNEEKAKATPKTEDKKTITDRVWKKVFEDLKKII